MPGYLFIFCCAFVFFALLKPAQNWDMIAYVGSAAAYEIDDPRLLHETVYGELKRSVSEEKYNELTRGYFREVRASDAESFRQHLPFYQPRVVYVLAVEALWKAGINPFFATYLVSALSAAMAAFLLAYILPWSRRTAFLALVPAIVLVSGFYDLGRLSTPDALAVAVTYLCYFLAVRRHRLLLFVLPFCVLVRTDLVLLALLFYGYLWWEKAYDRRMLAASALACSALYVFVNHHFGNYGWSTVFDYTLSHKSTHPADFSHAVTIGSYLAAFNEGVGSLLRNTPFWIFAVMTSITAFFVVRRPERTAQTFNLQRQDINFVVLSSLGYVAVHFMLFPVIWTRFFAGQYALITAMAVYLLLDALSGRKSPDPIPDSADDIH